MGKDLVEALDFLTFGVAGDVFGKDKRGQSKRVTSQPVSSTDVGAEDDLITSSSRRRSVASTIRAGALSQKRNSLGG